MIDPDDTAAWRGVIDDACGALGGIGKDIETRVDALQEELEAMTAERDDLQEKLEEAAEQLRDAEK